MVNRGSHGALALVSKEGGGEKGRERNRESEGRHSWTLAGLTCWRQLSHPRVKRTPYHTAQREENTGVGVRAVSWSVWIPHFPRVLQWTSCGVCFFFLPRGVESSTVSTLLFVLAGRRVPGTLSKTLQEPKCPPTSP